MTVGVRQASGIEHLFGPSSGVVAMASDVSPDHIDTLRADERVGTDQMVDRRRAEFATGRACARAALASLGVDQEAIPRGERREPVWPASVTGSITHTRGQCVAVVARRADVGVIGIDVEQVERLHPGLERHILTEPERERVAALDGPERQRTTAVTFAAKEAFYKAHHQLEPRYLGFDTVEVHAEGEQAVFVPHSGAVDDAVIAATTGRFLIDDGLVVCGVLIRSYPPTP